MVPESTNPGLPCLKELFLSYSWSFGEDWVLRNVLSLEGTFNKGLTNLDMVVLSSLSLGLWKTICFRKEDNKLFTSNFSALFIEAVGGGAVPIVLWVFERAAMVAVAWKLRSHGPPCFSFYNGRELSVSSKAFGTILQEKRHCYLDLMVQTKGQPFLYSFHLSTVHPPHLTSVSGCIRSLAFTRCSVFSCTLAPQE